MQIDKVPLKYLTPELAAEYKAIRKKYQKDYKVNQKLFQKMFKISDIAVERAKEVLKKKHIGKYFKDFQGNRYVHITGAKYDEVLECTMIQKQENEKDPSKDYLSIYYNTSFGTDMLDKKEGESDQWVRITGDEFEKVLKDQIKRIESKLMKKTQKKFSFELVCSGGGGSGGSGRMLP
jgi:hypothetical protein